MPNPAAFPAAPDLDGYTVEWDNSNRFGDLDEGTVFEHFRVTLDNGYTVSVARTNIKPENPSVGFDEGRWEAATMRPATSPMAQLFGLEYEPATELDDLNTHEPEEGIRVIGNLDNDGVVALLETVAARPAYEPAEGDTQEFDPFEFLFGPAPTEDEEWSE